jgi:hypothetical protein
LSQLPAFSELIQKLDKLPSAESHHNGQTAVVMMAERMAFLFNKSLRDLVAQEEKDLQTSGVVMEQVGDPGKREQFPGLWHQKLNLEGDLVFTLGHEFMTLSYMNAHDQKVFLDALFLAMNVPKPEAVEMMRHGIERTQQTLHRLARAKDTPSFLITAFDGDVSVYLEKIDASFGMLKTKITI